MNKSNVNKIIKIFNKLGKGNSNINYYICVWETNNYCTHTLEGENLNNVCKICIKLRNKLNDR